MIGHFFHHSSVCNNLSSIYTMEREGCISEMTGQLWNCSAYKRSATPRSMVPREGDNIIITKI